MISMWNNDLMKIFNSANIDFIISIRGILGSFLMISVCLGVMISYIAGAYLTYSTAPFAIMIFPIAFLVSFLILPESPNDLMSQKRYAVSLFVLWLFLVYHYNYINTKDAEKSLRFYKNCKKDTKDENERFAIEWEKVQLIDKQSLDRGNEVHFKDFCKWPRHETMIQENFNVESVHIL